MENELFTLALNDEGVGELTRFSKKARAIFFASLIMTIINFISVVSSLSAIFGVFRYTSKVLSAQIVITLGYLAATLILLPLQWFYYFAFSRMMQAGISAQDSLRFNKSFRLLNTHAGISFVVILVNILYFAYVYYSTWMLKADIR